ncbi:conserved hypothetical protein [Pyrococcus abyssi virus 1]|uniref:hypothetical protein n=1 Tax=Pyrococcus abyssi virus 1 TaxID=425386 RepID=UPI00015529C6|nr:hypothetical protein PAV1_ORF375 [Pyrococcus abyssi virus 1]ABN58505.1 conserved hypothetical protein [Pyrococcus abyssi virus 1]
MVAERPFYLSRGRAALAEFGKRLWKELVTRDPQTGGKEALIIGRPGAGKTTLLLNLMIVNMVENEEVVIWRGRDLEQIHKLPHWEDISVFYHYYKDDMTVYKVHGTSYEKVEVTTEEYKNPKDLLKKLKPNKVNVVYAPYDYPFSVELFEEMRRNEYFKVKKEELMRFNPNYFWYELFWQVTKRKDRRWLGFYIDEFDDIFPSVVTGIEYWFVRFFKNKFKDFRKARVSLYAATHSYSDVHWMILPKFQTYIYLQDATVPPKRKVEPTLPLGLEPGQMIIDSGRFGIYEFSPLPQPNYDLQVEIRRKKGVNYDEELKALESIVEFGKSGLKYRVLEIAKRDGKEAALAHIKSLKEQGKVSESYYYKLRKLVLEGA